MPPPGEPPNLRVARLPLPRLPRNGAPLPRSGLTSPRAVLPYFPCCGACLFFAETLERVLEQFSQIEGAEGGRADDSQIADVTAEMLQFDTLHTVLNRGSTRRFAQERAREVLGSLSAPGTTGRGYLGGGALANRTHLGRSEGYSLHELQREVDELKDTKLGFGMYIKGSREELDEAHAGRVSAERTAAVQEARAESREQALLAKSNEWKVDRMRLEMLLENRTEQLCVADGALHAKEGELDRMRTEWDSLRSQWEEERANIGQSMSFLEEDSKTNKEELRLANGQIEDLIQQLQGQQGTLGSLQKEGGQLREEVADLEDLLSVSEGEKELYQKKYMSLGRKVELLLEEEAKVKDEATLVTHNAEIAIVEAEKEVNRLTAERDKAVERCKAKQDEVIELRHSRKKQSKQQARKLMGLAEENNTLQGLVKQKEASEEELRQRWDKAEAANTERETLVATLRAKIAQLEDSHSKLQKEMEEKLQLEVKACKVRFDRQLQELDLEHQSKSNREVNNHLQMYQQLLDARLDNGQTLEGAAVRIQANAATKIDDVVDGRLKSMFKTFMSKENHEIEVQSRLESFGKSMQQEHGKLIEKIEKEHQGRLAELERHFKAKEAELVAKNDALKVDLEKKGTEIDRKVLSHQESIEEAREKLFKMKGVHNEELIEMRSAHVEEVNRLASDLRRAEGLATARQQTAEEERQGHAAAVEALKVRVQEKQEEGNATSARLAEASQSQKALQQEADSLRHQLQESASTSGILEEDLKRARARLQGSEDHVDELRRNLQAQQLKSGKQALAHAARCENAKMKVAGKMGALRDATARARGDIASDLSTFWTGVSSDVQKCGLNLVEEAGKWKQRAQEVELRAQAQLASEVSKQAQAFAEEKQVMTGSHLEEKIRSTSERQVLEKSCKEAQARADKMGQDLEAKKCEVLTISDLLQEEQKSVEKLSAEIDQKNKEVASKQLEVEKASEGAKASENFKIQVDENFNIVLSSLAQEVHMKPEVVSGLKSFEKATFTSSLKQMLESLGALVAQKADFAAVNERNRSAQSYKELAEKLSSSSAELAASAATCEKFKAQVSDAEQERQSLGSELLALKSQMSAKEAELAEERKFARDEVQAQVDKARQEAVLMAEMATQESLAPLRSESEALREAFEGLQNQYQMDMENFAELQASQRAGARRAGAK